MRGTTRRNKTRPTRTVPGHFGTKLAQHESHSPTSVQNSPSTSRTAPLRYKTHPTRTTPRQFRYKTHPARPKWLISARFARVWRTLYRCRQQETTQGELSTACEAETGLTNTTAHQAPLLWRAPEGPGGLSITGPGCGGRGRRGLAAVPVGGGAWPRCRWVAAGPGRASRSTTPSRRLACGDLAGGPPPTGTHSGPAHKQHKTPARHSKRGRHQPTPCASALTHP